MLAGRFLKMRTSLLLWGLGQLLKLLLEYRVSPCSISIFWVNIDNILDCKDAKKLKMIPKPIKCTRKSPDPKFWLPGLLSLAAKFWLTGFVIWDKWLNLPSPQFFICKNIHYSCFLPPVLSPSFVSFSNPSLILKIWRCITTTWEVH